ncbi:hypothetical protein [Tsuneonella sp. HG222]
MAVEGSAPRRIDQAEEALIACHGLWRRSPGQGKWPFAGDGPWHLIQGEVGDFAGDFSETLIETEAGKQLQVRKLDTPAPRVPLDRGEVAERDRVTAWLGLVGEAERRLVWTATGRLAAGEGRVPWGKLVRWHKLGVGPDAAARRYRLALARIVCALNGWPERRAKAMLAREGLAEGAAAGTREVLFGGEMRRIGG